MYQYRAKILKVLDGDTVEIDLDLGFKIVWKYSGLNEIGIDKYSKKLLVKVHKKYFRPNEVHYLRGDSTKAFKTFKWKAKIGFKLLVEEMINSDFKKIKSSIAK
jgi:GDPmannose 4,6-dehydratase